MAEDFTPNPNLKIWLDGEFVSTADAKISVFSHGLLYGDGVFEGIRVYNSRIFECRAHMERWENSLKAIRLQVPWTSAQIIDAMNQGIKNNNTKDGYIRLVALRGVGPLGIHPFRTVRPQVYCIVDKIQMYPAELYDKGMKIITAATMRNHPAALSPQIKSLNYLNNIMAKIEAIDAGCLEAVMLNHEGYVAECTGDNLFIITKGRLRTPAPHCGLLGGITRRLILAFAHKRGISAEETTLTRTDLYYADEMFITGTGAEVCPVTELDKRPVGDGKPGAITKQLIADFRAHTRSGEDLL
jgi:branched-chain amino acid aminotransferase